MLAYTRKQLRIEISAYKERKYRWAVRLSVFSNNFNLIYELFEVNKSDWGRGSYRGLPSLNMRTPGRQVR